MVIQDSIGFWIPLCGFRILPVSVPEEDISEWIRDSLFSGILGINAQYSRFHKQKCPGYRNPDYLRWGDHPLLS